MIVDIHEAMSRLAASRPIFHSEADFQHALAWELHARLPDMAVRLELPVHVPGKILHLDLWLAGPTGSVAIELKYKTRGLALSAGGEPFSLKDQSAQDLGRYDFLAFLPSPQKLQEDPMPRELRTCGDSHLKIGWNWIKRALSHGWVLLTRLSPNGELDSDRAMVSWNQYVGNPGQTFNAKFINHAKP